MRAATRTAVHATSGNASPRWLPRAAGAAALVAAALVAQPARAEPDLFVAAVETMAEAMNDLNFYSQGQAGFFAVSADDFRPGGAGLRGGFNVLGFGGSVGARFERYAAGAGALALLDFEFRPLPFMKKNLFRVVDPFASAGLEIGGGDRGFRATQTLGAGVDLGLFGHPETNHEVLQPVISLRYQFRLWQFPEDLPQHIVMLGAATRLAF